MRKTLDRFFKFGMEVQMRTALASVVDSDPISTHPGGQFFQVITSHGQIVDFDDSGQGLIARKVEVGIKPNTALLYVTANPSSVAILIKPRLEEDKLAIKAENSPLCFGLGVTIGSSLDANVYDTRSGLWLSAAPFNDSEAYVSIDFNRTVAGDWETFKLRREAAVSDQYRFIGIAIDALLSGSLFDALKDEAVPVVLVEALARALPFADTTRLAKTLTESSAALQLFCERLSAYGAAAGCSTLTGSFLPKSQSLSLSADTDYIAMEGLQGQYVSLSHSCNAIIRRSILPQYGSCIVSTARNEGIYLLEWIAYHKAIGIEAIFLYSNNNDDESDALLRTLAEAGEIFWINNRVSIGTSAQLKAYGHAFGHLSELLSYRWVLTIDIDEYLVINPKRFGSLGSFLGWHEAIGSDAIALNWVFHGPSAKARWTDDFIARRFPSPVGLDHHIKTISRPNKFIHSAAHVPVSHLNRPFKFHTASGYQHKYREDHGRDGIAMSVSPEDTTAWLNHYFFKSCEEFLWKWSRNRGDHAASTGRSSAALTANFVKDFMHFASTTSVAQVTPDDAAPMYESELARLLSRPATRDANERVKEIYQKKITGVVDLFKDSPGILSAGEAGIEFMRMLDGPKA